MCFWGVGYTVFMSVNPSPCPSVMFFSLREVTNKHCLLEISCFYTKLCCGYSLEVPHRGISNEYHNISLRNKKSMLSLLSKHDVFYEGVFYPFLHGEPEDSKT